VAEPDGLPQKYLRDFSNQTGVRTVSIRRRELRKRSWDPCRLEASQPYVLQFAKEEPLLPWMEVDDGGSAVPVLYLHGGFPSFLADWAFRVLENIREFAYRGGPTPAASTNTFEFVRQFARFLLPFPPPPIFLHLRTRTWANSSPFRWRIRSIFPAISRPS